MTPTPLTYPPVRRDESVVEELHPGCHVVDPYRWLEDPASEETKAFVTLQNQVTQKLFDTQIPFLHETKARMTELFNYERFSCPSRRGDKYFFFRNDGLQNQDVLYMQDSLTSESKVLLDPNTLAADGTASLRSMAFSEAKNGDGKLFFAHGVSHGGSDWETIQVLAVHDPEHAILEDRVEWAKFTGISWTHDDLGFFYSRYPKPKTLDANKSMSSGTETDTLANHQLWYHRLGTSQDQDKLVFAYPADPTYTIGATVSEDGKFLLIAMHDGCKNANTVAIASLENFASDFLEKAAPDELIQVHNVVDNMDFSYGYVLNNGTEFFFSTNANAPRERVVKCDIANLLATGEPVTWQEVIPEHDDLIVLEGVYPVHNDLLVLQVLQDVCNKLKVYDLQGRFLTEIPLPSVGTVGVSSRRTRSEFFFKFVSFLYPGTIYRVDLSSVQLPIHDKDVSSLKTALEPQLFKQIHVKGFDASQFEAFQVFFNSKDGTKVPMFIVKGKNLEKNGNIPTYMYGYGGFNISITPSFSTTCVVFLQNFRGMLAFPTLRGGGEYGEQWHQDGMLLKKQNVFDDLHSAAEYVIREGYTNPNKIAIHGGSNGGLLVAASCNQRPDLYRCGVAAVGVMDMLRFHKFTVGHAWRSDYGDPDEKVHFDNIIKYSPLHTVPKSMDDPRMQRAKEAKAGGFPALLLTTGDHDDRVVPLHSYKLIAELQHQLGGKPEQTNPLVIRIDTKSGHGAGKPTSKRIEESAEVFAFIAWCLDTKFTA